MPGLAAAKGTAHVKAGRIVGHVAGGDSAGTQRSDGVYNRKRRRMLRIRSHRERNHVRSERLVVSLHSVKAVSAVAEIGPNSGQGN